MMFGGSLYANDIAPEDAQPIVSEWACPMSVITSDKLEGSWIDKQLLNVWLSSRSWSDAMAAQKADISVLNIKSDSVGFNLNWHEGYNSESIKDPTCFKLRAGELWLSNDSGRTFSGPFVYLGNTGTAEEMLLKKGWVGCYQSEQNEKWCFNEQGFQIDGVQQAAKMHFDVMETPKYGTLFKVEKQAKAFLIFVPQPDGAFVIYQDDWASEEHYIPVAVGVDKPWRRLTPIR